MPSESLTEPTEPQLVSVIVPIYDVEEMLPDCLDSILAQRYTAWEAVLVIDGSPDGSEAIARRYAELDSRFRVIVTPNGGLGAARNVGLDHATGSLISFVDSDDVLTPDALQLLVAALEGTDAEISTGIGYDFFKPSDRIRYWTMSGEQYSRGWGVYRLDEMPSLLEDHVAWAKVIRRSLIDRLGIRIPERTQCEDIVPSLRMQLAAHAIAVVPEEVYGHRRHAGAISADYLRERTVGDWLRQAGETMTIIARVDDERLRAHYVAGHTLAQWWSRAEQFPSIPTRELLRGVEELAAAMLSALGSLPAELPLLRTRALRFFAAGGATARWATLAQELRDEAPEGARAASPLETPTPARAATVADAALRASALLDAGDELERELAVELLVAQVLAPAAQGVLDDAGFVERAVAALEAAAPATRAALVLPALVGRPSHGGAELATSATTALRSAGLRAATATGLRLERRGVVIRGEVDLAQPLDAAIGLSLVLRRRDGRSEHRFPAWAQPDPQRPDRTIWQAVVPADTRLHDEHDAWLRRDRRHRGAQMLPVVVSPQHPRTLAHVDPERATRLELELSDDASLGLRLSRRRTSAAPVDAPERQRRRIFTFPNWGENPYMAMLQTAARADGWELPGTVDPEALRKDLEDAGRDGVVHLHWTSPITEKSKDLEEAEHNVDLMLDALRTAQEHGRPIIWTLHNVLPHDSLFAPAAIRLHQGIADIADVVHTLGSTAQEAIGDLYTLPADRVRVLPHSSYEGVYGARLERAAARAAIGSAPDSTQVLFFGQIRPYKGVEQLIEAASRLAGTPDEVELLLAGKPAPAMRAALRALDDSDVPVTSALRYMEDDEIAPWFSAADVAVLPYRNILNSGTMHLAATYGVPVILPDERTVTADYGDQQWLRFFDVDDAAASIAELLASGWYRDPEVRRAAFEYAREQSPYAMGQGYLQLLDEAVRRAAERSGVRQR